MIHLSGRLKATNRQQVYNIVAYLRSCEVIGDAKDDGGQTQEIMVVE